MVRSDYAATASMVSDILSLGADDAKAPESPAGPTGQVVTEDTAGKGPSESGPRAVPEIPLPPPPPEGPLSPDFFTSSKPSKPSKPKRRHRRTK